MTFYDLNLTDEAYADVIKFLDYASQNATPAIIVIKMGLPVDTFITSGMNEEDLDEKLK